MNIKELKELSALHVSSIQNPVPKIFLDKIRKNLMFLMCQSDVVELTGDANAFGGQKEVASSVSKAVINLFCLSEILGADAASEIEAVVSSIKGNSSAKKPDENTKQDKKAEGQAQADTKSEAEQKKADTGTQKADEENTEPDTKTRKLEMYSKSFSNAKSKSDIDKVWKDITRDKELKNEEKFQLQSQKNEALKKLAA